jgi:hypothetical protein
MVRNFQLFSICVNNYFIAPYNEAGSELLLSLKSKVSTELTIECYESINYCMIIGTLTYPFKVIKKITKIFTKLTTYKMSLLINFRR